MKLNDQLDSERSEDRSVEFPVKFSVERDNAEVDFSSYLIIGGGRVARHFQFYFKSSSIPFADWTRTESAEALKLKIADASHILLLINDGAIEQFYQNHPELHKKVCVHFSGALVSSHVIGAHPLMTFSDRLYDLDTYRQIPFVIEKNRGARNSILPCLPNPSVELDPQKKQLYHALCVLAGNFTTMLWEKAFTGFENELELPKQVLLPYLLKTTENLALSPSGKTVLTGPLTRGDQETINKHLAELSGDPFSDVYRAFVSAYAHQKYSTANDQTR